MSVPKLFSDSWKDREESLPYSIATSDLQNAISTSDYQNAISTSDLQNVISTSDYQNAISTSDYQNAISTIDYQNVITSNVSAPTYGCSACDAPDELMSLAINAINARKEAYKNNNKAPYFLDIESSINSGGFSEKQIKKLRYAIKAAKLEVIRTRVQIIFVKIITGADEE